MLQKLKTARYWLLLSLVFTAPMSFTPSFALPVFDFPSFRVGLYQILATFFVLSCIPLLTKKNLAALTNRWFIASISLIFVTVAVGLVTTSTLARTSLYSASLIALLAFGLSGYLTRKELKAKQVATIFTSLLWSGVMFGALALVQLIIASFDRTALGTLCTGCSDAVFGFPRINLFAAEPQFFANSLIPALFASFFFRSNKRLANWALILSSLAIGLTFSRGAFAAIVGAAGVYILVQLFTKKSVKSFLQLCSIGLASVALSFVLLVASATIRYHDTPNITYNTAVSMLDHLSLGKLNIPQKTVETTQTAPNNSVAPAANFTPEGFVVASSNDRLSAASLAINAWNDSPKTVLFGVGMGNLGQYVNQHIQTAPSNLTVYIWYVLVVAELGLVGLIGLLLPAAYILWRSLRGHNTKSVAVVVTVTIAFMLQLLSFGSYINVMYQYLFIGVFVAVLQHDNALRTQ